MVDTSLANPQQNPFNYDAYPCYCCQCLSTNITTNHDCLTPKSMAACAQPARGQDKEACDTAMHTFADTATPNPQCKCPVSKLAVTRSHRRWTIEIANPARCPEKTYEQERTCSTNAHANTIIVLIFTLHHLPL